MPADDAIGTLALVVVCGLVARLAAGALRLPEMLLLLLAGVALGPHALGLVELPLASEAAQVVLTLGVAFILFHGGLQLSVRVLRETALGLTLLAVPGVVLTAAVTGLAASLAFGVSPLSGLLVGAALAPTDPAILVPLFSRLRLRPRLAQTIVAESALNDPTGAVLALAVAAALVGGEASLTGPAVDFAVDVAVSTAIGIAFGVALALVVSANRAGLWRESSALAVVAVLAASFVSIDFAGGSGYIGAFLAGLLVGNMRELRLSMHTAHDLELRAFVGTAADLVVILVFVTLGANLSPGAMADNLVPGLAVIAVLLLVARPLAVLVCLLPDRRARWTREELLFVAWTRETGVVPAALAGVLLALGVPDAELVEVTVALAVVVTLALQTSTKPWLARRLGLLEPGRVEQAGRPG